MNIRCFLSVLFLLSGAFAQQAFAQQAPFGRPDHSSLQCRPCVLRPTRLQTPFLSLIRTTTNCLA